MPIIIIYINHALFMFKQPLTIYYGYYDGYIDHEFH